MYRMVSVRIHIYFLVENLTYDKERAAVLLPQHNTRCHTVDPERQRVRHLQV